MYGNNRENEMQRSAGTILCCLATASGKNITISTKYDKYPVEGVLMKRCRFREIEIDSNSRGYR